MKNKTMKERIEECFMELDFETDRMSSGGSEAYSRLSDIVIELYNDNLKQQKIISDFMKENTKETEEESI